jgi:hypothetical protein
MPPDKTRTTKRLEEVIATYGADFDRWPEAEREAALSVLGRSAAAREQLKEAAQLDAVLDLLPPPPVSAQLEARILAAAPSTSIAAQEPSKKVIPLPSRRHFPRYLVAPLAAAAMAVLWLALSREPQIDQQSVRVSIDAEEPLLYAFADPDGFTALAETQGILPDDYLALANAFAVPVDDL